MKSFIFSALLIASLFTVPITGSASTFENPSTWEPQTVIQGKTDETRFYSLHVSEPKRITITLENDNIVRPFAVTVFDKTHRALGTVVSTKSDGDETKTVGSIDVQAGAYILQIHSFNHMVPVDFTASYTLEEVATTDIEPNNSIEEATHVPLQSKITGAVHKVNYFDQDYYTFDVPQQGLFTIEGSTYSSAIDPETPANGWYELYNENGKRVLHNLLRDKVQTETKNFVQPGKYTLLIKYTNQIEAEMKYTLNTSFEPIAENEVISNGINNGYLQAQLVPLNKQIKDMFYHNTSYGSQHHYYKVQLPKEMPIQITASSEVSGLQIHTYNNDTINKDSAGNNVPEPITITTNGMAGDNVFSMMNSYGPITRADYVFSVQAQFFSDVPFSHSYFNEIETMRDANIIKGYPNGTFHPNELILRKHVFSLLHHVDSVKLPVLREAITFTDLPRTHTYHDVIQQFYQAGIVDGYNNAITPESTLTRAQLAKILVNTFHLSPQGEAQTFKDIKPTDWYYDDVQILASHGITTGSDGSFMPNAPVTRQHFAVFLYRTLNPHK
ncbi:S-layer homology domain-containing protein [Sporosarcina sp. Te-1]|uniref:S-layer homology domain-containing protein n=1 Tax=Sporosarcina sp. Te-1 TaxID=2818390 RepID=UPI001A9FE8B6|nr:S-layer homology domain-containing protein [Sporosarcina sp. Te-1]QTD42782.1 S-layer homology domain-containing protein [Sporosarcina sp. Te-1]